MEGRRGLLGTHCLQNRTGTCKFEDGGREGGRGGRGQGKVKGDEGYEMGEVLQGSPSASCCGSVALSVANIVNVRACNQGTYSTAMNAQRGSQLQCKHRLQVLHGVASCTCLMQARMY